MRTFVTKQPSNQDSVHQKPVRVTPMPIVRSLSTGLTGSAMLQRKPSCACGGGCPRCQEAALLQTKLKISEPGDHYEQEADLIADRVMQMPEPSIQREMEPEEDEEEGMVQKEIANQITPSVQRQALPEMEEEEEGAIQPKAIDNRATPSAPTQESSEVPPTVHEVLRSPGQPLDPETLTFMESRFGQDFSQVRVHTDEKAAESAQAVSALAYSVGQDIVFGVGQFQPQTGGGQHLLAHELTHVVQQGVASSLQQAKLKDQSIYRKKAALEYRKYLLQEVRRVTKATLKRYALAKTEEKKMRVLCEGAKNIANSLWKVIYRVPLYVPQSLQLDIDATTKLAFELVQLAKCKKCEVPNTLGSNFDDPIDDLESTSNIVRRKGKLPDLKGPDCIEDPPPRRLPEYPVS
jgi:hypothetical protein